MTLVRYDGNKRPGDGTKTLVMLDATSLLTAVAYGRKIDALPSEITRLTPYFTLTSVVSGDPDLVDADPTVALGSIGDGTIVSSAGAPSNSIGKNNDYALDTINSRLYGPKAAGAWPGGYITLGGSSTVADNAVTTTKLNNLAVTTAKVADDAITNAKMADNSVGSAEIINASIAIGDLAFDPATQAELDANQVADRAYADSIAGNAELGYAAVTANVTAAGDVAGLAITVTVGTRPIKLIFDCSSLSNSSAVASISIQEGATVLATGVAGTQAVSVHREVRLAPSAGTHTYKVVLGAIGGTSTLGASSTTPAFIQAVVL